MGFPATAMTPSAVTWQTVAMSAFWGVTRDHPAKSLPLKRSIVADGDCACRPVAKPKRAIDENRLKTEGRIRGGFKTREVVLNRRNRMDSDSRQGRKNRFENFDRGTV